MARVIIGFIRALQCECQDLNGNRRENEGGKEKDREGERERLPKPGQSPQLKSQMT